MVTKIKPKPLRDIQNLFKDTFLFFKNNFKVLLPLALITIGLFLLFGFVLGITTAASSVSFVAVMAKKSTPFLIIAIVSIALAVIISLAVLIFQMLANATIIWGIIEADKKEKVTIKKAWRQILSKGRSIVWVNFLVIVTVLGGFLLFIIPGFIFSVWFSLALFVLLVENKKGWEALKKSKALIQGYFWPVVFRMIILSLALYLASLSLAFIPFFGYLANIALGVVTLPFYYIYLYLIYKNLRTIKALK